MTLYRRINQRIESWEEAARRRDEEKRRRAETVWSNTDFQRDLAEARKIPEGKHGVIIYKPDGQAVRATVSNRDWSWMRQAEVNSASLDEFIEKYSLDKSWTAWIENALKTGKNNPRLLEEVEGDNQSQSEASRAADGQSKQAKSGNDFKGRHLTTQWPVIVVAIMLFVLGVLITLVANVASTTLPKEWNPYLWLSWPLLVILMSISVVLVVWQVKKTGLHNT